VDGRIDVVLLITGQMSPNQQHQSTGGNINNKCQSNLAIGSIAANWWFQSFISPLPMGGARLRQFLGITQVSLPNGISLAGNMIVTDTQTYIQTYIQYRRTDNPW